MATYSATRTALVAALRSGYTARTIYADPTDELTAADEVGGWVEMEWRPGAKGPNGGRLGPTSTHYESPFDFTLRIMIPRTAGGDQAAWAAAWTAADLLEALVLEAQVGDLYIESVTPRPYDVEDGDSHVQVDLSCSGSLESVAEADAVASLGGISTASKALSSVVGPGLLRGDWIGVEAGPLWRRVTATEGEPLCLGVVSRPPDGTFVVTFSGHVEIPAHGWAVGPLYLSQTTAGAATSIEPDFGIVQRVGLVVDADSLVVNPPPEAVR